MVQRASEGINIGGSGQESVNIQQSGAGYASPDVGKFSQTHNISSPEVGTSTASRVLDKVLKVADKLADQYWQQSTTEAYLDGVAKAGTVENEQQLESNPMTRAWTTAGYRDTMGKLAQADYEAGIATDMVKWREKSPAEYQDYIAQKRSGLMNSFGGMSQKARESLFTQVMTTERAAIKKHGSEHYKYIVEKEQQAIQTSANVAFADMDNNKNDGAAYEASTTNAYNNLYNNIIRNDKLPDAVKSKMIGEAATYALESDHQVLYQRLKNGAVPHSDGTTRPMLDILPWEEQVKLSKQYRESMGRTQVFRSVKWSDDYAKMQSDWADPNAPLMPVEQVRAFADAGIKQGFMSKEKHESFMEEYYKASAKKVTQTTLANAFVNGDQQTIWGLKKTPEEALDAWVDTVGSKLPMSQAAGKLLVIGNTTGQLNAFKKVGQMIAPAIAQLGEADVIDPNNAATVGQILKTIDSSETHGREGATAQFMSAIPQEMQDKVMYIRENLRKGLAADVAIKKANERIIEDSKVQITPEVRAELSKENRAIVNEVTDRGLWGTAVLKAKSLFSTDAANELAITTRKHWFENQDRVNEAMSASKIAVGEELNIIAKTSPMMSIESRKTLALSRVANRTVMTESGPLVVPRGQTIQGFFGVDSSVGADRVATALQENLKPSMPDTRMAYSISNNSLMFTEYNKAGNLVRSGTIDPTQVKAMVEKQRGEEALKYRLEHGEGKTVSQKVGDKTLAVTFNGDNTAGVQNSWVYRLRERLVEHEGVRDVPYEDLSGKVVDGKKVQTVGVGVSSHNEHYPKAGPDGRVSAEDINRSFKLASDKAVRGANRLMNVTGKKSEEAFQFYAELAYQAGTGFDKVDTYKPLVQAIRNNDVQGAQAALRQSPAWKLSGDGKRRKFYEQTLNDIMKG